MDPNENHLRVETFIPLEMLPISLADAARVRSDIVDGAVRRRGLFQTGPRLEEDTLALLNQLARLESKLDALLQHFQRKHPRSVAVRAVILSATGLILEKTTPNEQLTSGTLVELRFQLPTHSSEEILVLAEVRTPPPTMDRLSLEFLDMAADQSDWLARYLLQRQREQAMNNQCKR